MAKLKNKQILLSLLVSLLIHILLVVLVSQNWKPVSVETVYELNLITSSSDPIEEKKPQQKIKQNTQAITTASAVDANNSATQENQIPEGNAFADKNTDNELSKGYDLNELSRPPRLKKEVKAIYPVEAKSRLLEGYVLFELIVGVDGVPRDIKLISSSNSIFEASAWQAVEQLRFYPGMKENIFVPVKIRYRSSFILK